MGRLLLIVVAALVLSAPAWADDMGDRKRALDNRIAALQGRIATADRKEAVLTDQIEQVDEDPRAGGRRRPGTGGSRP